MRADARRRPEGPVDVSPLVGDWINVNPGTDYLVRLEAAESGGVLRIRAHGSGPSGSIDWGEVEATPYVAGSGLEAGGFHARYDFGAAETCMAANQKLGILVIQSYTSFRDGSGRPAHFAREFFRRQ
jgi:hypothetical protein